jgi:hypothetical protein
VGSLLLSVCMSNPHRERSVPHILNPGQELTPVGRNWRLFVTLVISRAERVGLDFPRDRLLALAQEYVELVTPLVREHERLIDQSRAETVEHPLTRPVLEAIAAASNAVVAYERLLRELKGRSEDR